MTEHGFGKTRIASKATPPPEIIAEFVARISQVRGMNWVHVVKRPGRGRSDGDIIFEFGHPSKHGTDLGKLLQTIGRITVNGHTVITPIDVWIIESSHKG